MGGPAGIPHLEGEYFEVKFHVTGDAGSPYRVVAASKLFHFGSSEPAFTIAGYGR
jgi:hypothetical protein